MEDNEIRRYILQYFYAKRRDGFISAPHPNNFNNLIDEGEINDIIEQLSSAGLIDWYLQRKNGHYMSINKGKITAKGVDVMERKVLPPIAITFQQNITINQASGFQIGNNNNINKHL
jgi:hypothetical protein